MEGREVMGHACLALFLLALRAVHFRSVRRAVEWPERWDDDPADGVSARQRATL